MSAYSVFIAIVQNDPQTLDKSLTLQLPNRLAFDGVFFVPILPPGMTILHFKEYKESYGTIIW